MAFAMKGRIGRPMIEGPCTRADDSVRRRIYWRRFFRDLVGGPLVVIAAMAMLLSLYAASGPSPYFFAELLAVGAWVIAIGWWGIGVITMLALRARRRRVRVGWGLVAAPVLLIATVLLVAADLPLRTAFLIARPAMEQIAQAQLKSPDGTELTTDVNVYGTCRFSHDGDAVTIEVEGAGFMDLWGFVYCPVGSPHTAGRATSIGGPWYRWYLRF